MAELHFFTGTMDSGKSTLALQTNHNHAARGRVGRIFTTHDRAGEALLSSRLGLTHDAIEVAADFDFWRYVVDTAHPGRPDRLPDLRRGPVLHAATRSTSSPRSSTSSRSTSSPSASSPTSAASCSTGSARLVELADRVNMLQVEALCWCGKRATHNARTENGVMVTEGEVIVVGDVDTADERRRPRSPTRCSAASTTGAGSPPPGPRRSASRRSRCRSAEQAATGLDHLTNRRPRCAPACQREDPRPSTLRERDSGAPLECYGGTQMRRPIVSWRYAIAVLVVVQAGAIAWAFFGLTNWIEQRRRRRQQGLPGVRADCESLVHRGVGLRDPHVLQRARADPAGVPDPADRLVLRQGPGRRRSTPPASSGWSCCR